MTKKKFLTAFLLLLTVSTAFIGAQEGRELYEHGLELYREKKNIAAKEAFEAFIDDNRDSVKYDDALWYLGRIYNRLDQRENAKATFLKILGLEKSNRFTEAGHDLGKIYFSERRFSDVIELLDHVVEVAEPDSYEIRSIKLVAMSRYNLGVQAKREYRDEEAETYYTAAAYTYESLLPYLDDPEEKGDALYSIGKAYERILGLSTSQATFDTYKTRAEESLVSALALAPGETRPAISALLSSVQDEGTADYKLSGYALGGVDQISGSFGARVFADTYIEIPLNFRNELEIGATYSHNDFSFKTSNFDDLKIGDARLIETTDKVGADISWTSGSRRGFRNTVSAEGDLLFADDLGDDYWSVQIANKSAYRINPDWKMGFDGSYLYKIHPDYLVSGNKLDHFLITGGPWVEWYVLPWLDIGVGYEIGFKQYFASTYDTFSGAPSTENKQYLTNTGILELDAAFGDRIKPKLTYEITYQESNNYDIWVTGLPTALFIKDYYDYLKHDLDLDIDLEWSEKLISEIGITGTVTDFTNYIARDVTKTFTGETRLDLDLSVDAEVTYLIYTKDKSSIGLTLRGWWDIDRSNMKYESTFDTNHEFYGVTAGVDFTLR